MMARLAGQLLFLALAVALWRGGAAQETNTTESPEILIVPANTTALEGNTLILTCVGYGVPTPEVVWLKGGAELTNSSRISIFVEEIVEQDVPFIQTTLQICSLNVTEDPGLYACRAANENGTDIQYFSIEVEPMEVEIVIQPDDGEYREGNTVIFSCVASGSPNPDHIAWNRGGEMIPFDNNNGSSNVRIYTELIEVGGMYFVVSNLEICGISPDDGGLYSCSAVLDSGLSATSDDFWVNVTAARPQIVIAPADTVVREGETVLLTCVAIDEPYPPVVQWTYDGSPLSNQTSDQVSVYYTTVEENGMSFVVATLEICSIGGEYTGNYSCIARERDGGLYDSAYFNILVVEDSVPQIVIAPQNTTVTAGNTVLFSCVALATSSITPSVFWVRGDGVTLSNDSRISVYSTPVVEGGELFIHSVLEICSVEAGDENSYTCVANTSAGNDSSYFLLRVEDEGPPDIVIAPSDTNLPQGQAALFTCVATYRSAPARIAWYREYERVYNDSRITTYTDSFEENGVRFVRSILELCSAEPSDGGGYYCVAYTDGHPYRNSSAHFTIDIIEPEEEVQIVIAPSNTTVTANSTVLFTCVVYGLPLPSTFSWAHNNYTIYNTSDITIYFEEIEVNGVAFLQSVLEICGVDEEQGGYYSCSAGSAAGSDSETFELTVRTLEPPEIVIAPSDVAVTAGATILLTCVAIGSPTPSLSWHRSNTGTYYGNGTGDDRHSVYERTETINGVLFVTSIFEICSVEEEEEGEYGCLAENEAGNETARFNVTVDDPFEPPAIVIAPPDTDVNINDTVLFTCIAHGYPPPNITWLFGDDSLYNDSETVIVTNQLIENGVYFTQSILQLCGVTVDEREGQYTCVATNFLNSSQSSFYLNILEPPLIVIQPSDSSALYGSTVLLTCVATSREADRTVGISWERDSEIVTNSSNSSTTVRVYEETIEERGVVFTSSILELCYVGFEEEGRYSCVARDDIGVASADFTLSVFTEVSIVLISENTTAYAGATGLFTCVATGSPDPALSWRRRGYRVNDTDRITVAQETEVINDVTFVTSILQICDIDYEEDEGVYECVAEVPENYDTNSFTLTVLTQSPSFIVTPDNLTVVTGNEVTLTCQVESAPLSSVTWLRNNVLFTANASTTIDDIKTVTSVLYLGPVNESALYSCVAVNDLNNIRADAQITVQYPLVLSEGPSNTTVLLGGTAIFECSFSGSPPPSEIFWFRAGEEDPLVSPTYNVTMLDPLSSRLSFVPSRADHNSQYYCQGNQTLVDGGVVSPESEPATLTVNSPPVLSQNISLPAILNGTLYLTFTISGAQPPVTQDGVIWTFQSRSDGPDSTPVVITNNPSERYYFTYAEEFVRLRIHPVEEGDEGNYTVNVSNIAGSDANTVFVEVVVGAYITDPPNNTTVHVGLNATFQCVATSDPPHRTLWLFGGSQLVSGDKYVITDVSAAVSELVIVNVTAGDAGEYTCDVDNDHGDDMDTATLTVISTPVVTAVTQSPYIVVSKGTAVLSFTVENSIPDVTLSSGDWRLGEDTIAGEDQRFTFSTDFTSLTISPVHLADEGTFTLTVTNDAGLTGRASIVMDVQVSPVIDSPPQKSYTYVGENAQFSCTASGEPQPAITWMIGDRLLSSGDKYTITEEMPGGILVRSVLTVLTVMVGDEGYYRCVATNVHGSASEVAFLQPLVDPVVVPDVPGILAGDVGDPLTISFTITSAEPAVTADGITWYFSPYPTITDGSGSGSGSGSGIESGSGRSGSGSGDDLLDVLDCENLPGREINDSLSLSDDDVTALYISQLEYSNEGVYSVRVENRAGVDCAQTRVNVQAVPQIDIALLMPRVEEGGSAAVLCQVTAEPDAEVQFFFRRLDVIEDEFEEAEPVPEDERRAFSSVRGQEYYVTNHMLDISGLVRDDIGEYWCRAMNDRGNGTSDTVFLEVLVLPSIAPNEELYQFIAGQEVRISFTSSNEEFPLLQPDDITMWFQNMYGETSVVEDTEFRQLSGSGLTLRWDGVRPEDNGMYWIVAENDAGNFTSLATTVEVFINPMIERGGDEEISVTIMEGDLLTLTLTCNATGNPSPTVTWIKDGEFLVTTSRKFDVSEVLTSELDSDGRCPNFICATTASLTINSVTDGDTGLYACRASIGVDIPAAEDEIIETPYNLTVNINETDYCPDDNDPCGAFGECENLGDGFRCNCQPNYISNVCDQFEVEREPPKILSNLFDLRTTLFSTVSFTCLVTGNPRPTVAWELNGKILDNRVLEVLVIVDVQLEDVGMYRCVANNILNSTSSATVILSVSGIAQYRLIIRLNLAAQRKRQTAEEAVRMLVAMLNQELTGTKIGNATVYSVAIREDFDFSVEDIPLIFTFYDEEAETDDGVPTDPTDPGQVVEVTFDVAEIERVVEEDVMMVAMELNLDVIVEAFERFDGCSPEITNVTGTNILSWGEVAIGALVSLDCPCGAADLSRFATRECGGSFVTGGEWEEPAIDACMFGGITQQLCMSPELTDIERLVQNVTELDSLSVAVVTQLLEDTVDTSSGNVDESETILSVIDNILAVDLAELVLGQGEFNTSARLLSSLEILIDAYPAPMTTELIRDSFRFLLVPESNVTSTTVLTADSNGNLSLDDNDEAAVRVELTDTGDVTGLVFGVYTLPVLFTRRPSYVENSNLVLGSDVVSVYFSGQLSGTSLTTPVVITLSKSPLASENGTKTECSFWDQSLDDGYGAWSTDGCRLVSEDDRVARCECDHLTQFALLVDLTPVPTTTTRPTTVTPTVEEEEDDDSIGAGSYVGGLVCIVFLALIVCTYLATKDLRSSVRGVTLINSSLCLCALFISYLVSYYTTDSDWTCTIFSALFHYLFLVTSFSLFTLSLLKTMQPERLTVIFCTLLFFQFILPVVVVVVSAAPDQDNYINDEFCRPQQEPYWYGLLLIAGLIHIAAWCSLLFGLFLVHIRREKLTSGSWFEEWLGMVLTLLLFEVAWGFGLPATNSLGLGATRLVFQILFVIASAVLGLVMLIFFVFLNREAREVWTGCINTCIPGRTGGFYTSQANIEENVFVTGGERDLGAVGMTELTSKAPLRDEDDQAAVARRSTGAAGMSEMGEDPEHIVNPLASEHDDEDHAVEVDSEEVKMDLGMFDDDTSDAAKDTKL